MKFSEGLEIDWKKLTDVPWLTVDDDTYDYNDEIFIDMLRRHHSQLCAHQ